MAILEKYIKEPFEYLLTNKSSLFIGILLGFIGILPLELVVAPYRIMDIVPNTGDGLLDPITLPMIIILAITVIISILINIVITGYNLKVVDKTLNYSDKLPQWSNFLKIFVNGLIYSIGLFLLYLIIFILLALFGVILFGINYIIYGFSEPIGLSLFAVFLIIYLILFFVIALFMGFYTPLATVNYVKNGFLGLFDIKKVINLFSIDYLLIVIILWIVFFIINLLLHMPVLIINMAAVMFDNNILYIVYSVVYSLVQSITSFTFGVILFRSISKYCLDYFKDTL